MALHLLALRRRLAHGLLAAVLALAAGTGAARAYGAQDRAYPPLFGSFEVRSDKLFLFPKWTTTLTRYVQEQPMETATCSPSAFNRCYLQNWKAFVDGLRGRDKMDILRSVNRFANRHPYVTDPTNYGVPDYWATPIEFLNKDGDCEDYAITKFMSLKELGFDDSEMRVVVLQDLNLRAAHAVLVVYLDGTAWLLDNQVRDVIHADAIRHYRAIYSVNQTSWWLHRY